MAGATSKIDRIVDRLVDSLDHVSVDKEMEDYRSLGHENYMNLARQFLRKHVGKGTSEARSYFLVSKDRKAPMKTIGRMAQARLGIDVHNPNSIAFAAAFKKMGYQVEHIFKNVGIQHFPFVVGEEYSRQQDIHEVFGGQERGGISTPVDCPYIFIFTGKSGEEYGYEDGWMEDGVFLYTGEGQVGDMQMRGGNKAIADHSEQGKEILLFKILGKGQPVEFMGKFACQSWDEQVGPDRDGNERKTIRFHLLADSPGEPSAEDDDTEFSADSLQELRNKAIAASKTNKKNNWRDVPKEYRKRCQIVKAYVLKRANGVCELSGERAPFRRKNKTPYLEVHHTKRIADNGPDHPRWVAAINPTLHREIHSGEHGDDLNRKLIDLLGEIEEH